MNFEYTRYIPRPSIPTDVYEHLDSIAKWLITNRIDYVWSSESTTYCFKTGKCIIPKSIILDVNAPSCDLLAFKLKFCA